MNCHMCNLPGEFICDCQYLLICSIHLPLHISTTRHNSTECLDITLNNIEYQSIKKEVLKRIESLDHSIKSILRLSKQIVDKVHRCSKAAIINLENQVQLYLKLISLKKLSKSLKSEVEKVNFSTFMIDIYDRHENKEIAFKEIEKMFNADFIVFEMDRDPNELTLKQKQLYITSRVNESVSGFIEIKFSKDRKFAFCCKIYLGNFK